MEANAWQPASGETCPQLDYTEVPDALLETIHHCRAILAQDLADQDKQLSEQQLDCISREAVARLLFLRLCEIHNILPTGQLRKLVSLPDVAKQLDTLSQQVEIDPQFFSTMHAKGPTRTPFFGVLQISDAVYREILLHVCHRSAEVEVNAGEASLLGFVYEASVGRIPRLTADGMVRFEEQAALNRMGGVYYTPGYIVQFIIDRTLGRLWDPAQPEQGYLQTVLDPTCGGGSFLTRAYEFLLDRHRKRYLLEGPENASAHIYDAGGGNWQLTGRERERILLDHIFGVDIDPQAVAVTRQSLWLQMKSRSDSGAHDPSPGQRSMQDLAQNIRCGNPLADTFDWREQFPKIMAQGGFDAVIGNPPFIKEYTDRESFRELKASQLGKYYVGKMDLWYVFACLAIDLLRNDGLHSFIATNNWTTSSGAQRLREKFRDECRLEEVFDFGPWMAFLRASIQTMIYVVRKSTVEPNHKVRYTRLTDADTSLTEVKTLLRGQVERGSVESFSASLPSCNRDGPFTFVNEQRLQVLEKIEARSSFRLLPTEIAQGIVPNPDVVTRRAFQRLPESRVEELDLRVGDPVFVVPRKWFGDAPAEERRFLKPLFEASQLDRYYLPRQSEKRIIYLTKQNDPGTLPVLERHLARYREIMEHRRENQTGQLQYKHLHWPRDERFFLPGPKVLSVRKCARPVAVYTELPAYVMLAMNVIRSKRINLKLLTALLNSRLMLFWFDQRGKKQGHHLQIDQEPLTRVPLAGQQTGKEEQKLVDRVGLLVDEMIRLRSTSSASSREVVAVEGEVDQCVYQLYGLTAPEIQVVEQTIGG